MDTLIDVLSLLVVAASTAFAGYWSGRRAEQQWWTKLLTGSPTVVLLKATPADLTPEEPRHD